MGIRGARPWRCCTHWRIPSAPGAVIHISGPGVTPAPERSTARSRLERLSPAEQAELAQLDGPARAGDPAAAARLAHLLWRTDFADPDRAPDFAVEPLFAYPRDAAAAQALSRPLQQRLRAGLAEQVRRLRRPVFVLHGEDDPLPVECAIELAGRLPRAHLTVLPGVGHTPWLEDPAAVRAALRHVLSFLPE